MSRPSNRFLKCLVQLLRDRLVLDLRVFKSSPSLMLTLALKPRLGELRVFELPIDVVIQCLHSEKSPSLSPCRYAGAARGRPLAGESFNRSRTLRK